ncbi:hypothetical protein FPANT_2448 [Fusarium pseudoanthophilum]|uniref:Uncharacterized protein n=1 Tax=Fusarium pseudoanthophilum TaxID=48495 RepID=A0A8H5PPT1_9HYPO|nr:hypothetical protein FPANT_2448 [Fusarium pseudoanthophilum]
MSLSIPLKSSDIDPYDEDARRQWIINYLKAEGVYHQSSYEASYDNCVEEVAKSISDHDGFTRVGHLYFEYHVDRVMWQETFNESEDGMTPEWPWSESPNPNDMSQGLSHMYRQWRIDYHQPVDLEESITPFPTCMVSQPSLAKRREIWGVIYGDKPHSGIVVGPLEVTLPANIDFHRLVLGEGNKLYDNLCRLIGPVLVLTWTVVYNKASTLIIGINPLFNVSKKSLFVYLCVRRLWVYLLRWLKTIEHGYESTIVEYLEEALTEAISNAQSDDFNV